MVVRIYDANRYDLRGRTSQLRAAGITDSWKIEPTTSRNALLATLEADVRTSPRTQSVALVDCRAESGDLEQTGFRIIETIRRHELLWKATRPIIWVDELTEGNRLYARAVGAEAVLDDEWLDEHDGASVAEVIEWVGARPPAAFGLQDGDIRTFSSEHADPDAERRIRKARFERWFGFRPDDLDFKLLWGLAGAVELKFLYLYCAEQGWASERAARRACEKLQDRMRPEREYLDRAEPSNAEIARRFLAEASPPEPDPLAELAWPGIAHVRELLERRDDIRTLAYLEPSGRGTSLASSPNSRPTPAASGTATMRFSAPSTRSRARLSVPLRPCTG